MYGLPTIQKLNDEAHQKAVKASRTKMQEAVTSRAVRSSAGNALRKVATAV